MNSDFEIIKSAQQLLKEFPDPMYVMDLDNQVLWVNELFQERYGSDPNHWNHELSKLIFVEKEEAGQSVVLCKDGSRITVKLQLRPIYNDMNLRIADYGVIQECNPDELLIEDVRYKIAADNTSDVIVLTDNRAIVRYVSPSLESSVGYTVEEYEGMDAFDFIHPEDKERVRIAHLQAVQTKTSCVLEYRVIHSDGSTVHVEAKVKPVLDSFGNVKYVVAVVRDITARKKTEQLLENILESVNAAVWSTDKDFSYYTFCSESIEKISGIPRKEIMNNPIRLHDHIHPDDNVMLMGEVKATLDRGIPVNKVIRNIHLEEGETRWQRLIVHPYMNNMGTIERLDGMLLDITDKKKSELALEESEQRYKSLFENNLDGVFSIDLEGYFVNANQSFEKITGIRFDDLPDRCFIGLIYDEDHMAVNQVLFEVMKMQRPRDVECRIYTPGQGERIVHITFVPIFLSGELNGVHGIVKDITERKREEMVLIKSEERYKSLQQSITRFSNDLTNVMKVSELENSLIEEVKKVLPVTSVFIVETDRVQESNLDEKWFKIAEKDSFVYLKIGIQQPLLKIEEEWLETAVHYATILYDNLQLIEDLIKRLENMIANNDTPRWMLRLLFKLSEKERASLSSDLHDSVLQDLIIWYRKLESMRSTTSFREETQNDLIQIEEGLLDAIHQIRITCNELRPPFLIKMGLVESLKSLFSYARMFSNYEIDFSAMNLANPLNEDQILGMYRIVQELLNNASKHSKATKVTMDLKVKNEKIHFSYKDNGVGMDLTIFEDSFKHMGIAGIKNRVLSLEGEVDIISAPQEGLQVDIYIPITMKQKGERYGNIIG